MSWTETTRRQYRREGLRYASDMTDAEWALIAPFMPPANRIGRPRATDLRAVVNAILYIGSTGCQWRQLPKDFPPYSTVQGYFYAWSWEGRWAQINHVLLMTAREAAGREASPSAGIILGSSPRTSQSVKTTESGGPRGAACPRAGEAGPGGLPARRSRAASATSSPTAKATWSLSRSIRPTSRTATAPSASSPPSAGSVRLRHLFADGGYAGDKLEGALARLGSWTIEIVKRSDTAEGFELLPRRWVVERTFAALGRCRRLAKDFEASIASAVAWGLVAHIRLLTRRLARA